MAEILAALVAAGKTVLLPWDGHHRYDFVFDVGGGRFITSAVQDRCAAGWDAALRISAPASNQQKGIRWANPYVLHPNAGAPEWERKTRLELATLALAKSARPICAGARICSTHMAARGSKGPVQGCRFPGSRTTLDSMDSERTLTITSRTVSDRVARAQTAAGSGGSQLLTTEELFEIRDSIVGPDA